jgi:hypothetical protein
VHLGGDLGGDDNLERQMHSKVMGLGITNNREFHEQLVDCKQNMTSHSQVVRNAQTRQVLFNCIQQRMLLRRFERRWDGMEE